MKRATDSTKPRFLMNFWHFFDTLEKSPNIHFKLVYEQYSNLKSGSCISFKLSDILCPSIKNVSESVKTFV